MAKFRIVGISFDHMHMGDLLRLVHDHPEAEIAGLYDPDMAKMQAVAGKFGVAPRPLLHRFRRLHGSRTL
jgi:predicted dehydrogenase